MKLKVVVEKLNIRKSLPASLSDKSSIVGIAKSGFVFEGEEVVNPNNPSLGKWYKDANNLYYWGNGLSPENTGAGDHYPWWIKNDIYSVPDLWEMNDLDNVKIAVLDSGINDHIDFNFNDISGYNYIDGNTNFKNDILGHGTHVSGIIKAAGIKSFGIAPSVKLFVAKVCDARGVPVLDAVIKALEDIIAGKNGSDRTDIINMSFVLGATEAEQPKLEKIIRLLKQLYTTSGCLLVAASGDEGIEIDNIPAYLEECISVGSVDAHFNHCSFSSTSATLDIVAPGVEIVSSFNKDRTNPLSGTSQSSAIVSAICAFGVNVMKNKGTYSNTALKRKLLQTAISTGKNPHEYGFGIVSPDKFIKSLTL